MVRPTTPFLFSLALLGPNLAQAQEVLIEERFTGAVSTAGFTITNGPISDCEWVFAPDAIGENYFNQNGIDTIPHGGNFDEYFAFIDSDECSGSTSNTVESFLVSPPFDASSGATITLSFDHQFRDFTGSSATVQVFNGTTWTDVATWEDNVGYPNPPVFETLNITTAAGGSSVAQVRFRYYATWDWWWAIDNITVVLSGVGLDELHAQRALKVFPNPTNDLLNISLDGHQAHSITVVDAVGRTALEQRMASTVDVSHLADGAYTILLRNNLGNRIARTTFLKN